MSPGLPSLEPIPVVLPVKLLASLPPLPKTDTLPDAHLIIWDWPDCFAVCLFPRCLPCHDLCQHDTMISFYAFIVVMLFIEFFSAPNVAQVRIPSTCELARRTPLHLDR